MGIKAPLATIKIIMSPLSHEKIRKKSIKEERRKFEKF